MSITRETGSKTVLTGLCGPHNASWSWTPLLQRSLKLGTVCDEAES